MDGQNWLLQQGSSKAAKKQPRAMMLHARFGRLQLPVIASKGIEGGGVALEVAMVVVKRAWRACRRKRAFRLNRASGCKLIQGQGRFMAALLDQDLADHRDSELAAGCGRWGDQCVRIEQSC